MYLTKLTFDPRSPYTHRDLGDGYEMHRTVLGGFVGYVDPGRVLYRLERRRTPPYFIVLVQSPYRPNYSALLERGELQTNPETKTYQPAIHVGQELQFCLVANPTRDDIKTGKRIAYTDEDAQIQWLHQKAERNGFSVNDAAVISQQNTVCQRGDNRINIITVEINGALKVNDQNLFFNALQSGIGRAKGFGCGMLSIAKL